MHPGGGPYDVLVALHVLSALVGFGAVIVTGGYGLAGARRWPPGQGVRRYFRPGTNWPGRALYAVPVLGFALVAGSDGTYSMGQWWLWVSLVLWAAGTAAAEAVLWPAERRVQRLIWPGPDAATGPPGTGGEPEGLRAEWTRLVAAAAVVTAVFVVVVSLMVVRPGAPR